MASDPATQVADDIIKDAKHNAEKTTDMLMREALREIQEHRKKKEETHEPVPAPDEDEREDRDPVPDEQEEPEPLPDENSFFDQVAAPEQTKLEDPLTIEEARDEIRFDPEFSNPNTINRWSMATAPGEFAPDNYLDGGVILDEESRKNLQSAFMADITEVENAGYAKEYPNTAKMNVINSIDEHPDEIREELELSKEIQGLTDEQSDFLRTMSHEENPAIADAAIEIYAKTINFDEMKDVDKKFIEEQVSIGSSPDHPMYTARDDLERYYSSWENEKNRGLDYDSYDHDYDDRFSGGPTKNSAVYDQVAEAFASPEYDDLDLSIGSERGLPRNVVTQMRQEGTSIQSLSEAMNKEPGQYNPSPPDTHEQGTHSVAVDRGGFEI